MGAKPNTPRKRNSAKNSKLLEDAYMKKSVKLILTSEDHTDTTSKRKWTSNWIWINVNDSFCIGIISSCQRFWN